MTIQPHLLPRLCPRFGQQRKWFGTARALAWFDPPRPEPDAGFGDQHQQSVHERPIAESGIVANYGQQAELPELRNRRAPYAPLSGPENVDV